MVHKIQTFQKLKRHPLLTLALICAVAAGSAFAAVGTGSADNRKYCNMYMGCTCKCPPQADTRRGHDDHYDVKCPTCNSHARKQKKNIRSGFFCPETNDWVN